MEIFLIASGMQVILLYCQERARREGECGWALRLLRDETANEHRQSLKLPYRHAFGMFETTNDVGGAIIMQTFSQICGDEVVSVRANEVFPLER